jgi:hypothetical protein
VEFFLEIYPSRINIASKEVRPLVGGGALLWVWASAFYHRRRPPPGHRALHRRYCSRCRGRCRCRQGHRLLCPCVLLLQMSLQQPAAAAAAADDDDDDDDDSRVFYVYSDHSTSPVTISRLM